MAGLIYEGADLLDFTAPMQVISHVTQNHKADDPDPIFDVKVQKYLVHTATCLRIERDILLPYALDKTTEYDILIESSAPGIKRV